MLSLAVSMKLDPDCGLAGREKLRAQLASEPLVMNDNALNTSEHHDELTVRLRPRRERPGP
jgi:hypothetical protein